MRVDSSAAQRVEKECAALRVGALGARQLFEHSFVAPEARHEPLQDVAYPSDAEGLAAFDACDGPRIAGQDGDAQVGSEGL